MGSNEKPLSRKAFNDQRPWGSTKRWATLPQPPRGSRGPHCRTGDCGCWLLCAVREVLGKTQTPHSPACKSGRAKQKSWCRGAEKLWQRTGRSRGHLRSSDVNKARGRDRSWLSAGPLLGQERSYWAFLPPGCQCHQVSRPQFSLLLCHSRGQEAERPWAVFLGSECSAGADAQHAWGVELPDHCQDPVAHSHSGAHCKCHLNWSKPNALPEQGPGKLNSRSNILLQQRGLAYICTRTMDWNNPSLGWRKKSRSLLQSLIQPIFVFKSSMKCSNFYV